MLNAAIESLVSKVQNGVVIQFEKIGPDPPPLQNDTKIDLVDNMKGMVVKYSTLSLDVGCSQCNITMTYFFLLHTRM